MQRKKLLDGTITRLEEYLKCTYTLITVGLNTRSSFTKLTLDDDNANNRYRSYHIVPSHRYPYPIIFHILPVTTIIMLCVRNKSG